MKNKTPKGKTGGSFFVGRAGQYLPCDLHLEPFRQFLDRTQEIEERFQIVSLNRQIKACENLLKQNQPIDVAILGQFKAGKSSFLNSLIGKEILPVGAVPVPTIITRLQYGTDPIAHHEAPGSAANTPFRVCSQIFMGFPRRAAYPGGARLLARSHRLL